MSIDQIIDQISVKSSTLYNPDESYRTYSSWNANIVGSSTLDNTTSSWINGSTAVPNSWITIDCG